MTNRKFRDAGFTPVVAYLLIASLFLAISFLLFKKIGNAQYIYLFLSLPFFSRLSNRERNDFLRINFLEHYYRRIRLVENLLLALPFALFLCWERCFLLIIPLIIISLIFSMIRMKNVLSFTMPTPFSKYPFEFSMGFRNTFFLFPIPYYFTAMAVLHDNFNLGAVALIFIFLIVCSYYFKTDNSFYVWIFSLSPKNFLRHKIKKAILYTFLLCVPVLLTLIIFYWQDAWILLIGFLLGCLLLMMIIYAKYSAFPDDIGITEMMLIVASICFLLFFIIIPHFRSRAIEKLNTVLE